MNVGKVTILHPWRDAEDDQSPITRDRKSRCSHKRVRLDQDAHKVFCRDCDLEVDPFAFLIHLVTEWDHWVDVRESAEKRAKAAQARLEETLRLERNARARTKRRDPQARLPDIPWGER